MRRLSWALLALAAAGCVREVDLPLEPPPVRLVVAGLLTAGEPVSIRVTRVGEPFAPDSAAWIRDASVAAYQNDSLVGHLRYLSDATYALADSSLVPQPGDLWQFSVSAPGFPDALSQPEQIPMLPQLVSAAFEDSVFVPTSPGVPYQGVLTLSIADPPGIANHYRLALQVSRNDTLIDSNWLFLPIAEGHEACKWLGMALSDICFDGELYPLSVRANGSLPSQGGYLAADSVIIRLEAISRAYFEYISQPDPLPIEQIFSQPDPPFSNVQGGYGIIGSRSAIRRAIAR